METAFNKRTKLFVNALEVYKNGAYQNIDKAEWVAPIDKVYNWNVLEKLNITEVPVFFRKESFKIIDNIKKLIRSPCFSKYPNSPADTNSEGESELHKTIKNFIIERIIEDDILFLYSSADNKNTIKISELDADIYQHRLDERTIQSSFKTRADILIPLKNRNELFGNGIILEIQLSNQDDKELERRTIQRGLQGYSVAWLSKDNFYIKDGCIFLKNNYIELRSFKWIISELTNKNIKKQVETELGLIEQKIYELKEIKEDASLFIKQLDDKLLHYYNRGIESDIEKIISKITDKKTELESFVKQKISMEIDDFDIYIENSVENALREKANESEDKILDLITKCSENKIKQIIEKQFESNLNKKVKEYVEKNLDKIYESKIDVNLCPICNKQMKIGKTMSGDINWYCKDYPYCNGIIKSGDINGSKD